KRAVAWNLVDGVFRRSKFEAKTMARARALADEMASKAGADTRKGVTLGALDPTCEDNARIYKYVTLRWDHQTRIAELTVQGPSAEDTALAASGAEAYHAAGDQVWALRALRELDNALLHLRVNLGDIGLVLVRARGDAEQTLAHDKALFGLREHWFAREVILHMGRVFTRMDLTSRSFFAMGDADTAFAGCLFELAMSADRFYLLDDPDHPVSVGLGPFNGGALPMTHGYARIAAHLFGEPDKLQALEGAHGVFSPEEADDAGLVTVLLDDIDWEDDTRVAIEERISLSPDALTGMEANLRFPGLENANSKIFARLTAWQNWIFIRPNATGPQGALSLYGKPERPSFDYNRV
ncbi:MAG: benzoyl-CoA-dihydrodiol lyase, partial [Nannocystaceae bacterium]